MKSVQFFKDEIEKLKSEMADAKKLLNNPRLDDKVAKQSRGTIKRNKKKVDEYSLFMRYAETSPTKDYLQKEEARLSNRISKFMETYVPLPDDSFDKKTCAAHKKNYEKDMGIPKLRKQLSAMLFLLK